MKILTKFLSLAKQILDPDLHQPEKWDLHQNVLDPPHCFDLKKVKHICFSISPVFAVKQAKEHMYSKSVRDWETTRQLI